MPQCCFLILGALALAFALPPPNLVMVLQDDLGHYDVGWNNPDMLNVSGNITALAKDGVILNSHYVFYWCSPTRRSFLTGRLPMHHGEMLSDYGTDEIDLRWTTIAQKLKQKGYMNYWFGKGHTGYLSMNHLPINLGFDKHVGFLIGAQHYNSTDRWQDQGPSNTSEYSTTLFGEAAVAALAGHDASVPFFLYLPWQAVHSPYDDVPDWPHNGPHGGTYRGMLWATDVYMGRIVELLHSRGMWENTLIVYSSDNGGIGSGNNFPYRGEKRTNFEGGMRVAAFVSGGLLPKRVRGTVSDVRIHVVDWYATFCGLASVPAADGSPVPPAAVPASDATPSAVSPPRAPPGSSRPKWDGADYEPVTDIYGDYAWPDIDGVDVWDMIVNPASSHWYNRYSAHSTLVLSHEVILREKYKLLVAQAGNTHQGADHIEAGWRQPDGKWVLEKNRTCGEIYKDWEHTVGLFKPCLFDLESDPREEHDLSESMPELVNELYKQLNDTWRTYYSGRSPPELLGHCDPACARKHWASVGGIAANGPICGLAQCASPTPSPVPTPPAPVPPSPVPTPPLACVWHENTGLNGKHISCVPAASREVCCSLCLAAEGCLAANFNNKTITGEPSDTPMCHLKSCSYATCGKAANSGTTCEPKSRQGIVVL